MTIFGVAGELLLPPGTVSTHNLVSSANEDTNRANINSSVLVVDDEENLLVLLDKILSKEGYQVKTANTAYEALEFFDESDISVALIDIRMYPIDGIALLAEIKKRSPSTHVIMMTSCLTTETENLCMRYGATNYITKPLEIQKLKIALRGLLA
jgi:DNA-binding NtrC family response regulator